MAGIRDRSSQLHTAAARTTVPDVPRLATLFCLLLLAFPGAALAQGAGDDQYQDPFGDTPVQDDSGTSGSDDDGLSDTPPNTGGGGGSGDSGSGGSGGGSGSGSGSGSSGAAGDDGAAAPASPAPEADEQPAGQLPNTGSDPRALLLLGLALVLTGVGLRLRTIDPDAY
jgi:LPXTG-motif cell wall-anchored protein